MFAGRLGLFTKTFLGANCKNDMATSTDEFETIWVEISKKDQSIIVVAHRHPSSNLLVIQDEFFKAIHKLSFCNFSSCTLGDHKLDFPKINHQPV